jgi:hypothetical protein
VSESDALELLRMHSYSDETLDQSTIERGFLGMLRPFSGKLYEENFHELMAVLRCLQHKFTGKGLDREVISSFWSICHLTRSWAIDEGGMLRRNNLLSETQIKQLTGWIDCISYTIMILLEDAGDESPFDQYQSYA